MDYVKENKTGKMPTSKRKMDRKGWKQPKIIYWRYNGRLRLKGFADKICSLQSYVMLTKAPTRGCNVLRTKFNIMAAIFVAIPPFAHIFASIAPTYLGRNRVRIEVDK